ncbi:MAG: GerMN domain-containing protein, partial [Clostridia bacterium]|nr:GerMN domain-containing protein [Clostridia bacterium]
MEKNRLKIIFGILIIIIAVGGFFAVKWVKENNNEEIGDEYTPQAEISEEQARQTIVSLYFPSKDTKKLTPEARLIDIKELMNIPYEKLMNLLIEGPRNDKLENIIPKGTKVLKTFTENVCLNCILTLTKTSPSPSMHFS